MNSLLSIPNRLTLSAQAYNGQQAPEWDRFVDEDRTATFCHLSGWHELMREVFGLECKYEVAVGDDGTWHGILPLVRIKSRFLGHHLRSLPYLNYGGPLGTSEARRYLVTRALEEAHTTRADSLELRDRVVASPVSELTAGRRKITVLLNLPEDPDQLWENHFNSKLRSQIRRPHKDGMTARFGRTESAAFYEVFSRNMRDLGTPVLPRKLFERLPVTFGDRVVFGAVYHKDVPVAAGCGLVWRNEFEMTWASSLREYNRSAPNMLLYWSFMQLAIKRGLRVFNFGRCTPEGGTHRFKKQWQGRDLPLPWTEWTRRPAEDLDELSFTFRAASAGWRRLPLPVANRLGPIFARRLASF